jgi:hypothetical protein
LRESRMRSRPVILVIEMIELMILVNHSDKVSRG